MDCRYCGAQIHSDDHRCGRCGRRVSDEPVRRPTMPPVRRRRPRRRYLAGSGCRNSAAPARTSARSFAAVGSACRSRWTVVSQTSLFGPMEVAPAGRSRHRDPVPQASVRRRLSAACRPISISAPSMPDGLSARLLRPPSTVTRTSRRPVTGWCGRDRPDIPCCGFAVFLSVVRFSGGPAALDIESAPYMGAALLLLVFFYRVVCCLGNWILRDTVCGSRVTQLRRVSAWPPSPAVPSGRGIVSTLSAGIGLLWALLDEERLTWHDYMSGTFPALREAR